MVIARENKKVEAEKRMRMLGYFGRARAAFAKSNKIFVNEAPFGAVYELDEQLEKQVAEFEKAHDALVYMVVRGYTQFGVCDSLLYVGDNEEEWEYDRADLLDGVAFSYTINQDAPDCSEFGSIGFRLGSGAGLVRVA